MALLYRRDLVFLGYEIHLEKVRRKRILSSVCMAEMVKGNKVIPCVATFYKLRNGIRVDYIVDRKMEKQVIDELFINMRQNPKHFVGYFLRLFVNIIAILCGIMSFLIMPYTIFGIKNELTFPEFSRIYNAFVCMMFCYIENYLISIL